MRSRLVVIGLLLCATARVAAAADDDEDACPDKISWKKAAKIEPMQTIGDYQEECVKGRFPKPGWLVRLRVTDHVDHVGFERFVVVDSKQRVVAMADGVRRKSFDAGTDFIRVADLDHDGVDEVVAEDRYWHKDDETATMREIVIAIRGGKPVTFDHNAFAAAADDDDDRKWDPRCPPARTLARRLSIRPGRAMVDVTCMTSKHRLVVTYSEVGDELEDYTDILVVLGDKGGPIARMVEEGVPAIDAMMVSWGFKLAGLIDLDRDGADEIVLERHDSAPSSSGTSLSVLKLGGKRLVEVIKEPLSTRVDVHFMPVSEHETARFAKEDVISCQATHRIDAKAHAIVIERHLTRGARVKKSTILACEEGVRTIRLPDPAVSD